MKKEEREEEVASLGRLRRRRRVDDDEGEDERKPSEVQKHKEHGVGEQERRQWTEGKGGRRQSAVFWEPDARRMTGRMGERRGREAKWIEARGFARFGMGRATGDGRAEQWDGHQATVMVGEGMEPSGKGWASCTAYAGERVHQRRVGVGASGKRASHGNARAGRRQWKERGG